MYLPTMYYDQVNKNVECTKMLTKFIFRYIKNVFSNRFVRLAFGKVSFPVYSHHLLLRFTNVFICMVSDPHTSRRTPYTPTTTYTP